MSSYYRIEEEGGRVLWRSVSLQVLGSHIYISREDRGRLRNMAVNDTFTMECSEQGGQNITITRVS